MRLWVGSHTPGLSAKASTILKNIIFFRQSDSGQIEIVRVLHERMDLEANLSASRDK
jgi:plasmid stabilization system protein ParE